MASVPRGRSHDKIAAMLIYLWLGGLTALLLGVAAFSVWAAQKARAHRMVVDQRLGGLGRELFEQADALSRRCDDLRAAVDHLGSLEDRLRLLELERELARLAAGGKIEAAAASRLEDAVAALRGDIAAKEP